MIVSSERRGIVYIWAKMGGFIYRIWQLSFFPTVEQHMFTDSWKVLVVLYHGTTMAYEMLIQRTHIKSTYFLLTMCFEPGCSSVYLQ